MNTSRAALAVTFNEIATDEDFTAVINHFKSKSGNGTGADADQGDGQGGMAEPARARRAGADPVDRDATRPGRATMTSCCSAT